MAALVPGLGITELVIILLVLPLAAVPAFAIYRIAQKAGYASGTSTALAVGYLFAGWIVVLILGFSQWPREQTAQAYAHPAPPAPPAV